MHCKISFAEKYDRNDLDTIKAYKSAGDSMKPFLQKNILIVKKVPQKMLHVGDIIVFTNARQMKIVHRIVKKIKINDDDFLYQTMGDANNFIDASVRYEDIIGKVFFVEGMNKYGKYVLFKLDTFFKFQLNYLFAKLNYFWTKIYYFLKLFKNFATIQRHG